MLVFGLLFSTVVLSGCGKSDLAGDWTYYDSDNARITYNVTFDSDKGQVATTEYISGGEKDSAITKVLINEDSQIISSVGDGYDTDSYSFDDLSYERDGNKLVFRDDGKSVVGMLYRKDSSDDKKEAKAADKRLEKQEKEAKEAAAKEKAKEEKAAEEKKIKEKEAKEEEVAYKKSFDSLKERLDSEFQKTYSGKWYYGDISYVNHTVNKNCGHGDKVSIENNKLRYQSTEVDYATYEPHERVVEKGDIEEYTFDGFKKDEVTEPENEYDEKTANYELLKTSKDLDKIKDISYYLDNISDNIQFYYSSDDGTEHSASLSYDDNEDISLNFGEIGDFTKTSIDWLEDSDFDI